MTRRPESLHFVYGVLWIRVVVRRKRMQHVRGCNSLWRWNSSGRRVIWYHWWFCIKRLGINFWRYRNLNKFGWRNYLLNYFWRQRLQRVNDNSLWNRLFDNLLDERLIIFIVLTQRNVLGPKLFGPLFDEFHFVNWNGTLAINPLPLNNMFVLHLHYRGNRADISVRHKSKTSWLLSSLVFKYYTVLQHAELSKVCSEVKECEIVWKASNKNLPILRIRKVYSWFTWNVWFSF